MATFNDLVYTIDLRNPSGTVLPPPSPFLSFIAPPQDSNNDSWLEAVIKINLNDPSINNPYDTAEFNIEYDADPLGMTNVNIGDSQTNDGGGGDGATQSNDAELNIGNQDGNVKELYIFARDNAPSQLLKLVPSLIPGQSSQINLTVKNNFLAWDNNQGISGSLSSPFLYALKGQSDSEGPINYDIFAGFNRVINGSYRLGSGVAKVTVRLMDTDNLTVNTLKDGYLNPNEMSLRKALSLVNPGGTINFTPGLAGTIYLDPSLGELLINKALTIEGSGSNVLAISGGDNSRIFKVYDGNKSDLTNVTIKGLKIRDGVGLGAGGGIWNAENLTISNCAITQNIASAGVGAGSFKGAGGGIFNDEGILNVFNSNVSYNLASESGGGVYNNNGELSVNNTTFLDNETSGQGGGIYNATAGKTNVTNTTISGNFAFGVPGGGGIFNAEEGKLVVNSSTIQGNEGGGSPNRHERGLGGGISNFGEASIINSTISQNSAVSYYGLATYGGGVFNGDSYSSPTYLTIINSTIAGNSADFGGGIYNSADPIPGYLQLTNSIVADSVKGGDFAGATPNLQGRNLIEDGSVTGFNVINQDPKLGLLENYGGLTQTYVLLPGSPAIDAADLNNSPTTDQRGVTRPQGSGLDIGAFELEPNTQVGTQNQDPLNGTTANDVIFGLGGNDTVAGGLGDDRIFGGDGDDVLRGDLNQRDPQVGKGGNDFIDGGKGNDRIGGKGGNDKLYGSEGDDQIWGDDGDDLLRGGLGNDTLTGDDYSGGRGRDTFVLAQWEGTDTVTDFRIGEDLIGLASGLSFNALTITQQGVNALIGLGSETLAIMTGINANNLISNAATTFISI